MTARATIFNNIYIRNSSLEAWRYLDEARRGDAFAICDGSDGMGYRDAAGGPGLHVALGHLAGWTDVQTLLTSGCGGRTSSYHPPI